MKYAENVEHTVYIKKDTILLRNEIVEGHRTYRESYRNTQILCLTSTNENILGWEHLMPVNEARKLMKMCVNQQHWPISNLLWEVPHQSSRQHLVEWHQGIPWDRSRNLESRSAWLVGQQTSTKKKNLIWSTRVCTD